MHICCFFFFQAEDGIRDLTVTGVQTCALPIYNALEQGRIAAAAITGKPAPGLQVPWFWSDQYDVKLQMVGLSAGHDEAVVRRSEERRVGKECRSRWSPYH